MVFKMEWFEGEPLDRAMVAKLRPPVGPHGVPFASDTMRA